MALINQSQASYYNEGDYGGYQFTTLKDIIDQFMFVYVGEDKIISKASRTDVAFHAQRALAELSFDILKSHKAQEITVPASLQMILPQDYVNYTKISCIDSSGIKKLLYPVSKTSNPSSNPIQDSDGNFRIVATGTISGGNDQMFLDVKYSNILVGMSVSGVGIVDGTKVKAVGVSAEKTVLTLDTALDLTFQSGSATNVTSATYVFTSNDGSLLNEPISQVVKENGEITNNNAFIDFEVAQTDISIGDLVSHEFFPVGTVVTGITSDPTTTPVGDVGTRIYVSNPATDGTFNAFNRVIAFTSQNSESETWARYKSHTPSENNNYDDYEDDIFWPNEGERYGLDPQHAQTNGSFYIDNVRGLIHFSSNISGKTVILDYISDSLGTDDEMVVHKFAEEAMYKCISYAVLSSRINTPEVIVRRYKKEKFAETRKAKLRLSNLKLEELTQILRGKSKHIKH